MADRVLKALPGDRYVVQGISNSGGSRFSAVQANAEEFTYKIDFTRWLDGATISTNTVTPVSATISTVVDPTSLFLTLTISAVSGSGQVEINIVASDGRSKDIIIALIEGRANVVPAYIASPESASSRIGFNNTSSGLAATDVQEALDELAASPTGISGQFSFVFDGGGLQVPAGTQVDVSVPFTCTITGARLLADQATFAVVDVWVDTYGNFPPTVLDSIVAADPPTLSGALASDDTILTGWTTALTAGQIIRVNLNSNTAAKRLELFLKVIR